MESLIRHMLVEAFNEYDLSHSEWSNVIHLGHATFDDVMQLFYEGQLLKEGETLSEEEKEKTAAEIKSSGTVMGRQVVVHENIPRMMIADHRDGDPRDPRYTEEFLFSPATIIRLAAAAEKRLKLTGSVSNYFSAIMGSECPPAAPELADTKG